MNWIMKNKVSLSALIISLAITLVVARLVSSQEVENQEKDFNRITWEIVEAVRKRVQIYVEALHAGKALFDSSESVSRYDWNKFYNSLAVDLRYPGIQSYQFVRYIPHGEKEKFIESVRNDKSLNGLGYPDFKIWPEGDRSFYVVVDFIEPWAGNSKVHGLNTAFEEKRYEAVELSRDTGEVHSTSKVTLVQETGDQAGIIIYLPVYKQGAAHGDAMERRKNFVGFITGVFRIGKLMDGAIANSFLRKMNFEIFDAEPPSIKVDMPKWSKDHGLYTTFAISGQSLEDEFKFKKFSTLPIAGRNWMVITTPKEEFFQNRQQYLDMVVLAVGIVISALLFLVLRFFEALGDSEQRFRRLAEAAFEGVVVHDKGVILDVNNAFATMTGYPPEELVSTSIFNLVNSPHLKTAKAAILSKSGDPARIEIITNEGGLLPIELRCREIVYEGSEAGVAAIYDLTEQEKAEFRLKEAKNMALEANKLKDKFLTLVSHDLRSPLGAIVGLLSTPQMKDTENKLQTEIIARVNSISTGLITMINKLMDISRLQTGAISVSKTNVRLFSFLAFIVESLRYQASEKQIELVMDVDEDAGLLVDENLFGEVIQNLVTNAIKFTRQGGRISIEFSENPNNYLLVISDNGVGINPNQIGDLFRHEVKTTTYGTSGEAGTGLGLPLCKDIITAHGGSLSVESTVGVGSRFTIELPKVSRIVMVVDDQDVHRNIIKEVLKSTLEVEVLEAETAEKALSAMAAIKPDLLITDVHMPGMGGLELTEKVKSDKDLKSIPVIVISSSAPPGDPETDIRKSCHSAGADDFSPKPIVPEYFLPTVKRFLG